MERLNLIPNKLEVENWGQKEFSESLKFDNYTLYVRKDSPFINFFRRINLRHYLKNEAKDLLSFEFHIDEDDIGKVLLVETDTFSFVAKKIKKNVNVFHEFFIAELLKKKKINTINPIGIYIEQNGELDSYLLIELIPNSISLHQVLCKSKLLYKINPYIENLKTEFNKISKKLGEAINSYILSGIIHEELDFKNICLSYKDTYYFHFIDFERTKYFVKPPDIDLVRSQLYSAIARRINRYQLENEWTANFIKGYFSKKTYPLSHVLSSCKKIAFDQNVKLFLIDGFAASGKTSIAEQLKRSIKNSVIIETDWFIKYSRAERNESEHIKNNHFLWYDLEKLQTFVNKLLANKTIKKNNLYNHSSGKFDNSVDITTDDKTIIIIEGMYSSICKIESLNQLNIFLEARKEILLKRFSNRDSSIRNVNSQLTKQRFELINYKDYNAFRLKFRNRSHILLSTDKFEFIKILNLNTGLFVYFL